MRITIRKNIRVEVHPDANGFYYYSLLGKSPSEVEDLNIREANRIKDEITRHVDDLGDIAIIWETSHDCSFCGYSFTESEMANLEPSCCDDAIAEFNLAKERAT